MTSRQKSSISVSVPTRILQLCSALWMGAVAGCNCDGDGIRALVPQIAATPDPVHFGTAGVGARASQWLDIQNVGTGDLRVEDISVRGSETVTLARGLELDCEGKSREGNADQRQTIASGTCARVLVVWAPVARGPLAEGTFVHIVSTDPDRPELDVPVTGTAAVPGIRACLVNPNDGSIDEVNGCIPSTATPPPEVVLDFGRAALGDSVTRKVRIFNTGDGPLLITRARAESETGDFATVPQPYTGTIEPAQNGAGGTYDLDVVFAPQQGDGPLAGKVVIPSNDMAISTLEVPFKAEALGPRLCIDPPAGLDFGRVVLGQSRTLKLTLSNCGYVPYEVKQLDWTEDDIRAEGPQFTILTAIPPRPHAMAPGDKVEIDVQFTPKREGAANGSPSATGRFAVRTDYQSGNVPVVGAGERPSCGASADQVPTANIQARLRSRVLNLPTDSVEPLDIVTLSSVGSVVPRGGARYLWRLVSQPPNGTAGISGSGATVSLYTELQGDYVVELVVADRYDCQSAPRQVTIRSISKGKVHVQLTWPEVYGDVDLHYLGPGGAFNSCTGDVFYGNKDPDWGANGTTLMDGDRSNDATLDIDDTNGNGPENMTHDLPFDGDYKVVVHHYSGSRANTPNVKIFVNGTRAHEATQRTNTNEVWEVAWVRVRNGGTQITVDPIALQVPLSTSRSSANFCP